jgi:hypothetical protein
VLAVVTTVAATVLVYTIIAYKRLKQKPDNMLQIQKN